MVAFFYSVICLATRSEYGGRMFTIHGRLAGCLLGPTIVLYGEVDRGDY